MSQIRKSAEARQKDLKLAMYRIERGRSHTKAGKLSVSAVAREAGVTPALIHNHYPAIAEEIRLKLGASIRQQRDKKASQLRTEREKSGDLRQQLVQVQAQVAKLASLNEMLLLENAALRAQAADPKVRLFAPADVGRS